MDTLMIFAAKYLYIAAILIALWYVYALKGARRKQFIILAVISLPVSYIIAKIAGHFYFDPRPFVVEHIQPLIPHAADNGFPSDHTLICAAIAAVVTVFSRKTAIWLWLITIVVAISRVYVKVHHPADVIGSIVIAGLATWLVYLLLKKYSNIFNHVETQTSI